MTSPQPTDPKPGPRPAWSEPFIGAAIERLSRAARLDRIDRDWAFGDATGRGVTACIIDSGIDAEHPAVAGRVIERVAVEVIDGEPTVVPDQAGDLFGHGTACAGILVAGAPEVEIVSVRVLGSDLKGKGEAFLMGLEWAIDRGVDVINLSLSSRREALYADFHELVDRAYFSGVAIVSAANNVPVASYPSLFSGVLSVAAHEEPDPWRWYYNPRPPVEFGAWGVNVPIAWKDGDSTVATGNSFAAPHISALVALLRSRHPGLTPFEVKAALAATADTPPDD